MKRTQEDFAILVTTKSITVTLDGDSKIIRKENPIYETLLIAIREKLWDQIPSLLSPESAVVELSNGQMSIMDNQVSLKTKNGNNFLVPHGLNETILLYIEEKLPFESLVAFALKLSENPSYRSVQQLFSFIERNHLTITENGNFIAYKKVRSDYKDCYTGTMNNSPGMIVSMPRNEVDEDPKSHCSRGLHVANYNYAHNIYRGDVTLFVEVNPKDVVSVPEDYDCSKMRICEYKVLGISLGEFKEHIYNYPKDLSSNTYDDENEEKCDYCGSPYCESLDGGECSDLDEEESEEEYDDEE